MADNTGNHFNIGAPLPKIEVGDYYLPPPIDYVTESDAKPFVTNYYIDDGWQLCSGPSLRGHIVNAHLQPHILDGIGLPLYDVEVAKVRGIGLGWVVRKAMQRLELSDGELSDYIADRGVHIRMTLADYRLAVVKTIGLISQQGMAHVPWRAVNRLYKGASEVTFDPTQEGDMSFLDTDEGKRAWQESEAQRAEFAQFEPIHKSGGPKVMLEAEFARDDFKVRLD